MARRLANLRLSVPGESAAEVADWCGAMQAQDLASGKWSLGVRLPGTTEADIDAALASGEVLRTWPMRRTIHIVHPRNAHWMLDLTGRRALNGLRARWDDLGLDRTTAEKAASVLAEALRGRRLTRSQCLQTLRDAGIDTSGQRAYHLLWHTAQIGVSCIGPNDGKEQTFVLLDEWAPNPLTPDRDEALALLATMYFRSHGPATRADFVRWTGLTATDGRRAIDAADLRGLRVEGREMFDAGAGDAPEAGAQLLPGFDEFVLGYKERGMFLEPRFAQRIVPGGNGIFRPGVVVDGHIVGTWKRHVLSKAVRVTIDAFQPLPAHTRAALEAPAQRYADYLGRGLELRFG